MKIKKFDVVELNDKIRQSFQKYTKGINIMQKQ